MATKWIVIQGTPLTGFVYTGPFETEIDAWDYNLDASDYYVAELNVPIEVTS
jgi:hypothetical protein